jgi:hypothetical protein
MYQDQMSRIAMAVALTGCLSAAWAGEDTFKHLDRDADGYISAEEAGAHQGLTMEYISSDTDQDGKINAAEFSAFEIQNDSMQPVQDK